MYKLNADMISCPWTFFFTDYTANITTVQRHYMEDGVEVTLFLEENQMSAAVMYNISIVPPTPFRKLIQENSTIQITNLTYNIPYSVSINASVCRKSSGTAIIPLLFSKF